MSGMRFYSDNATPEFEVREANELDVWNVYDVTALKRCEARIGWIGRNDDRNYVAWVKLKRDHGWLCYATYDSKLAAACAIIAFDGKRERQRAEREYRA